MEINKDELKISIFFNSQKISNNIHKFLKKSYYVYYEVNICITIIFQLNSFANNIYVFYCCYDLNTNEVAKQNKKQ